MPFRLKLTFHAYEQIWTEKGSPLIISTLKLGEKLAKKTGWKVSVAMRYEHPSIHDSLINLKIEGFDNIYVVPLYPHNAMSTVVTTQVEVLKIANEIYKEANIKFIEPFYNNQMYIDGMANSIQPYINDNDIDKVIFSYHGIPERHTKKQIKLEIIVLNLQIVVNKAT